VSVKSFKNLVTQRLTDLRPAAAPRDGGRKRKKGRLFKSCPGAAKTLAPFGLEIFAGFPA